MDMVPAAVFRAHDDFVADSELLLAERASLP
jgi:hypothetical protein